ncbi:recombinase family protein [Phenylobacterium sp. 58.2.17]|uniref:recombinase family protein n=1 Tax=Phenylobacterium sp. 58.2.17 TaxID=2969306 RepID=UPI0022647054|nr:recombinase family protein [Phenylobacterium sp. 58.2.17]MCX7584925.1 recombinase family protein [Phenylobacterium sp. 58.2.17]
MAASDGPGANFSGNAPPIVRVAQYVRMSTDHQRYSTENQADAILKYAEARGMRIVRTYSDEGKSGLNIGGRSGLQQLIEEIQAGADFEALLVYDVSRWGRFQDADESAYYEYLCRRAGVRVIYCAEPFENDGTPIATIVKSVKRAMAGEYSRELSSKVFAGQCRLIELGFRQGGVAGYGLRRLLVDDKGEPKGELERGQHKSLQTDRVVLAPGPSQETSVVRRIYQMFVVTGLTEAKIAFDLNAEGIVADQGKPWTRGAVHQVLTNEKYVGNNVFNRSSFKLKQKRVRNPPEMWVRANGAFESVVAVSVFELARQIILDRSRRLTNEEMLGALRRLYEERGALSGLVIDEEEHMPSSSAFRSRFGSLLRAYQLIGYRPDRDYRYLHINARLRELYPAVVAEVAAGVRTLGGRVEGPDLAGRMRVNDELTLSVVIARCRQTQAGGYRWRLHFDTSLASDIMIAVRMDAANRSVLDYYLFPRIDIVDGRLRLMEDNGLSLDAYRFDDLAGLFELTARVPFAEAA